MTKDTVIEMRALHATGEYTHERLGKMFGVCRRQATDIINKVNWAWVA